MKITQTQLLDVFLMHPEISQENGFDVIESFNLDVFHDLIDSTATFVQDNHSMSKKGVLRGLHYQVEKTQGKLVQVLKGEVFDVVVDLRQTSKTFGQWVGVEISSENKKQIWIPKGFAHGFLVLSDEAEFLYKTTDYWHAASEQCIVWNDKDIGISWPQIDVDYLVSDKDKIGLRWIEAPKF